MPFPFSFRFSVPGIPNPFLAPTLNPSGSKAPPSESTRVNNGLTASRIGLGESGRRSPSLFLAPPQPSARKRGWVPSGSELSHATAVSASTSGYLDTPAKYRDMAPSEDYDEDEIDEMVADLPAPKRRRTLAGSIVSTALSAALIGTAVGLTVYRLWRDRGKGPEALPPPPYEAGGWVPPPEPSTSTTKVTPPTPRSKKQRHIAGRRTHRHRKVPSRSQAYTPPRSSSPDHHRVLAPAEPISRIPEVIQDELLEEEAEVEDQMDWMGDRLAQLIEEGKRALGTEVVVMSESHEDAVDDGMGGWIEDGEQLSASRSFRKPKSRSRNPIPDFAPPSYSSPQSSPRKDRFAVSSISRRNRGLSVDSDSHSFVLSTQPECEASWETTELRESMERARAMYRQQNRM